MSRGGGVRGAEVPRVAGGAGRKPQDSDPGSRRPAEGCAQARGPSLGSGAADWPAQRSGPRAQDVRVWSDWKGKSLVSPPAKCLGIN